MGSPVSQVAQPMSQPSQGKGSIAPNLYAVHKGSNFETALGENGLFSKAFGNQPTQQPTPNPADVAVPDGTAGQQVQPMGKGGRVTYPGQGGQPQMGQPNNYSNTVGQWDNASIQPKTPSYGGKSKGA